MDTQEKKRKRPSNAHSLEDTFDPAQYYDAAKKKVQNRKEAKLARKECVQCCVVVVPKSSSVVVLLDVFCCCM